MGERALRALLIEDDPGDVVLAERNLATSAGDPIRIESVSNLSEGLHRLTQQRPDVVLLDLHLPDSEGVATVTRLRGRDASVPIVVFTGAEDEATALAALREGAQDYLVKGELSGSLVRRAVRYAIERRRLEQENRRLEQRLRQAQKLESLVVFSAGLGYGLSNLVGSILDRADAALLALSSRTRIPHASRQLIEVRQAAFRAAELANQMRTFAGVRRPTLHRVYLSAFVIEMSELLDAIVPGDLAIQYDLPSDLPPIEADVLELRQVLIHLVLNASEAIAKHRGLVRIETGTLWADRVFLENASGGVDLSEGNYVFLRVQDNGRAMDSRTRSKIFDPFFTTKLAGRGLGLASVAGAMRQHRGAIKVESEHREGTTFTLLFPPIQPIGQRAAREPRG